MSGTRFRQGLRRPPDGQMPMDLTEAILSRRMVRSFTSEPVAPAVITGLCDLARRAPSAGNAQATAFIVLDVPSAVQRYWDTTLPAHRRDAFAFPGLLVAPVIVLVGVRPATYVERYAEADKARTGLGAGEEDWRVPYWWFDAGAAAEHLLLGAVHEGLGACLFGLFDHEPAVVSAFGVPDGWRLGAAVAIGHPRADRPGRSSTRVRRPLEEVVHRNGW
ncbi:MAG: nitroreductase family protein [Aquihabitans sp.]